ncbi:MutS protein msh4 [Lithohypha guttulata]|uniref:MutS protein msh4 n=1 Tax=Lithohypha guttulata TaxID=1690604 RepID=UPI00315D6B50
MGARLLRNNVLQPSTDKAKLEKRWAAVTELSTREGIFHSLKDSLKLSIDTDRTIANLVLTPRTLGFDYMEQSQNLTGVLTEELKSIQELCDPVNYEEIRALIDYAMNQDAFYSQKAADIRNQRVYAIRAGANGFLDVARQSYSELVGDMRDLVNQLQEQHGIPLELKHDPVRHFYIQIKSADIQSNTALPDIFVHVFRKGNKHVECQTIDMVKQNQRISDMHNEIIAMSDSSIQTLINEVRGKIHPLFKISEGIALLDLLTTFATNVTSSSDTYICPEITPGTLALKSSRHPLLAATAQKEKYIPNDVYATSVNKRFQIITGCNMSGKSTYIRSIALNVIMAQTGNFVTAEYASIPITEQLLARISTDDSIEANVSTFAAEMRDIAFILRSVSPSSLIIIDELGRGTSTADGLSIAIAISEALIQSKAIVYFVTHFRELPRILGERIGVLNMHMNVDIDPDFSTMCMRYKVAAGQEEQKFYGLALAQLVNLPDQVMEVAVASSKQLNDRNDGRVSDVKALAQAKRRKLLIHIREMLLHARDGQLHGKELLERLKDLQTEFLLRLAVIEADVEAVNNPNNRTPNERDSTPSLEQDIGTSDSISSDLFFKNDADGNTEGSWKASIQHENPLFRPMPTGSEAQEELTDAEMLAADISWLTEKGDSLNEPICIEDDDMSVVST